MRIPHHSSLFRCDIACSELPYALFFPGDLSSDEIMRRHQVHPFPGSFDVIKVVHRFLR